MIGVVQDCWHFPANALSGIARSSNLCRGVFFSLDARHETCFVLVNSFFA